MRWIPGSSSRSSRVLLLLVSIVGVNVHHFPLVVSHVMRWREVMWVALRRRRQLLTHCGWMRWGRAIGVGWIR